MRRKNDDLDRIDLNLMRVLDALLAERHVTRAARRLGLSQPAVSHALARLRALLGDPLLVRGTGGGLVPTARAEALGPPLRRALEGLVEALREPGGFDPATARRTFRVGASDYAELVLLPRLAARLGREAPAVSLWVQALQGDGDAELASGELDMLIGLPRGKDRAAGCHERRLFRESFTCVVRAGHPAASQRLTLARYCALPHLLVAPRGKPGSLVDDTLAASGHSRRIALAVPHFLVAPHVIAASDLVATLATRVVATFAPSFGLVQLAPPLELPGFSMSLVWHERAHHEPASRWLREALLGVAAEIA